MSVRLARTALTSLAVAAVLAGIVSTLATHWPGPRPVRINVRWAADVSDVTRQDRERRLGLAGGEFREDRTWQYELTATDHDSVARLVQDPAVEDTSGIDRSAFRVAGNSAWEQFLEDLPVAFSNTSDAAGAETRAPWFWPLMSIFVVAIAAATPPGLAAGRWLTSSVTPIDHAGLSRFRLCFGLTLAAAIAYSWFASYSPTAVAAQRHETVFADWAFIRDLAADPSRLRPVTLVALAGALVFAAGWRARAALLITASALTILVLTKLRLTAAHDWDLPLITLWALLAVPWDRREDNPSVATARGFGVWLAGFMLALGFLAAAIAKLNASGWAWITGGAIRYHFVQDAVPGGFAFPLWIASTPWAAVLCSAAAIVIESGVIVGALSRRRGLRLAAAVAALMLLLGFKVAQNVFWPAWWMLLLSFAPWAAATSVVATTRTKMSQARVVAALAGVQLLATAVAIEIEPFISNFPMYSWTWASPASFNEEYRATHRDLALMAVGPGNCAIDVTGNASDLTPLLAAFNNGPAALAGQRDAVLAIADSVSRRQGWSPARLIVQKSERWFDFDAGVFRQDVRALEWTDTAGWREESRPVPRCGAR